MDETLLAADSKCSKKEYSEAITLYKQYLAESGSNMPAVHSKLASCYAGLNEYEIALDHAMWSIANGPGNGDAHFVLGAILGGMYDVPGALRESITALGLQPLHPYATWNKAMYLLQLGEYSESWKCYQSGILTQARPIRNNIPKGTPQEWFDKTVHIWCEQGHGDIFMGARFLSMIKQYYNCNIIFETYDDLLPIFFNHPACDVVYKRPDNHYMPYPDVDYSFSLWDIPYLMSLHNGVFDPCGCYSHPSDVVISSELLEGVKPYIDGLTDKFKIGVCWQGSSEHANDCNRSSTFDEFVKPLLNIDNTTVFGLQYGETLNNVGNFINLGNELANWAITGAYLTQMDLVITADTALAHLAGVLGIPTWIICPFSNEWRWGYHPDPKDQGWKSDWYGTNVKIYRQTIRKDWNSIMPKVVEDLNTCISLK